MTEFQELVKDAPKFASMERGELVAYAYGMYAAGAKTDAENAKLRELCKAWREFAYEIFDECFGEPELNEDFMTLDDRMEALGIEVD